MIDPSEAAPILAIRDLEVRGDNGFRLRVPQLALSAGDILGVVGANGSGKTSLIEAMLGLRQTRSGTTTLFGSTLSTSRRDPEVLRRIGVQLQNASYPENFKVREIVSLHAAMYRRADPDVGTMLGIAELHGQTYGKLSRGQKQRTDLYVALAHRPELAFLDEPGTGLDQGFQAGCSRLLRERADDPKFSSVICSHDGEEIEGCNRVIWLRKGAVHNLIGKDATAADLRSVVSRKLRVHIASADYDDVARLCEANLDVIHFGREDARTVTALGHAGLADLATRIKSERLSDKVELMDADGTDFLRVVALESECRDPARSA